MRAALVFVPEWRYCRQPYLALPYLAAAARRSGHDVRCFDLNLGFVEYMAGEGIYRLCRLARRKVYEGGGLGRVISDLENGYSPLVDAAWLATVDQEWIAGRLLWALALVRDPNRMDDVEGHRAAAVVVDRMWDACRALLDSGEGSSATPAFHEVSWRQVLAAAGGPNNPFGGWIKEAVAAINSYRPDVVGVSIAAAVQLTPAVTLALALREAGIGPVVLGGNVVTRLVRSGRAIPELLSVADALLPGEGENAFCALLGRIAQGGTVAGPGAITYGDGVEFGPRMAPPEVARLAAPDFSDLAGNKYLAARDHLPVLAGRGCYWRRCAFCAHHAGYAGHRLRNATAVAAELRMLSARYGVDVFTFEDDDLSPRVLKELAKELAGDGLRWGCYARLEREFDPDLCKRLAAAGCRYLFFGLESGCQRTLDRINKGISLEVVPSVLQACRQAGIYVHLSLQFGFPGEIRAEAEQTLAFVDRHHELIDGVSWQPFRLEPLSPLGRNPERYGVVPRPFAGEVALYRNFSCSELLPGSVIEDLGRRLARLVVARAPSFILNHFPAYYAYYFDRQQLVSWWRASVERARARAAAVMTPGLPVMKAPAAVLAEHDGRAVVFDWSVGVAKVIKGEVKSALRGEKDSAWKPPPAVAGLFEPVRGGTDNG